MNHERVWADIDLDAVGHNLDVIRRAIGPKIAICQVVKADAYGHGAVAISHHAVRCGVAMLGVGTSAEALELRSAGVRARILVLGTLVEDEVLAALRHGVEIGLHSSDRLHMLEQVARERGLRARVHLNVDTGMGRLGVLPERAPELLRQIEAAENLELAGIMTHVTSPGGAHDEGTLEQMRLFEGVLERARRAGLRWGWAHAANTACVFSGLRPLHDAVRVGISTFGATGGQLAGTQELRPVLSLRSQVVFLKDIPSGTPVSYGSTWIASRPTRLATLPLGYHDGLPVRLSNRGEVLLRGQRAPIAGRVTMDYTMVDVTDIPGVRVGDRATVIGCDGQERIRLEDIAQQAETIPYEVTCSVGVRVPRIFHGGETWPRDLLSPVLSDRRPDGRSSDPIEEEGDPVEGESGAAPRSSTSAPAR